MDSLTSTDRLAEVNGGSTYQQGAEESVQQVADSRAVQPMPDNSAVEMVFDNQHGGAAQQSSMLEAQGSVEPEAQPLLEETGEAAPQSVMGMVGAGETTSAELGGSNCLQDQAPQPSGHGCKRKSRGSEVAEVADNDQELLEEAGYQQGEAGLQRVPSDEGMLSHRAAAASPLDACDSNAAPMAEYEDMPLMVGQGPSEQPLQLGWLPAGQQQQPGLAEGTGDVVNLVDQPTDAEILAWQNQIMEAEGKDLPLVGDREPLEALQAEYAAGSPVFVQKIEKLKASYGSIRRSRGDGNCFFRSLIFAYLESLIAGHDEAERDRLVKRLGELKQGLLDAKYEELVFEGPLDMVLQMLRAVDSPTDTLSLEVLESNMRSGDVGNYVLFLLRMLTTAEIKRRADFFAPFILGMSDMDVDTFCSRCVDPMGEESDHVQLVALTDTLQVPLRVVYLDRSLGVPSTAGDDGGVHVDTHDFFPEGLAAAGGAVLQPRVHLLYRPGHYDILYPL
ncbi:hypothetical protein N2152v2_008182 [Parachlorella kessleri]